MKTIGNICYSISIIMNSFCKHKICFLHLLCSVSIIQPKLLMIHIDLIDISGFKICKSGLTHKAYVCLERNKSCSKVSTICK